MLHLIGFSPNASAVTLDNPLHHREADASPLELFGAMECAGESPGSSELDVIDVVVGGEGE